MRKLAVFAIPLCFIVFALAFLLSGEDIETHDISQYMQIDELVEQNLDSGVKRIFPTAEDVPDAAEYYYINEARKPFCSAERKGFSSIFPNKNILFMEKTC